MHASRIGFLGTAVLFATIAACSDDVTDPASINNFNSLLSGALVKPTAVNTPGTGSATFSHSGGSITFTVNYSALMGNVTASHIHVGTPTQPTGSTPGAIVLNLCGSGAAPACPANQTGSFTGTADATYLQAGVSMDSVLFLMRQRNAYINVHTATVPGGEIRGNVLGQP